MDIKTAVSFEFVRIKGKNLYLKFIQQNDVSDLPYLIFLHEGLGCIDMWKDIPELLSNELNMNALVYDRQGYGKSDALDLPRPKNYLEVEALEYLPELMNRFKISDPILIGHSDGGTIALVYASKFPTKAVIAEAAHIYVEEETIRGIEKAKNNPDLSQVIHKLKKYHGAKSEMLFSAWTDTWLSPEFFYWNVSACLSDIRCPVLVIQGKEDEYASLKHVDDIISGLKNSAQSESFTPEKCGHVPHLQAKEAVMERIVKFIKKIVV